jgi:hypothetical protein
MAEAKNYDKSYKEKEIKLAKEIGNKKASNELGVLYKFQIKLLAFSVVHHAHAFSVPQQQALKYNPL